MSQNEHWKHFPFQKINMKAFPMTFAWTFYWKAENLKELNFINDILITSIDLFDQTIILTSWYNELIIVLPNKALKKIDVKTCKYLQKSLLFNLNFYFKNKLVQPLKITTKDLYHILTSKKCTRSYAEGKWEKAIGMNLNAKDW